jgi:hypothetical protein
MMKLTYQDAKACLLIGDISDISTFDNAKGWVDRI